MQMQIKLWENKLLLKSNGQVFRSYMDFIWARDCWDSDTETDNNPKFKIYFFPMTFSGTSLDTHIPTLWQQLLRLRLDNIVNTGRFLFSYNIFVHLARFAHIFGVMHFYLLVSGVHLKKYAVMSRVTSSHSLFGFRKLPPEFWQTFPWAWKRMIILFISRKSFLRPE